MSTRISIAPTVRTSIVLPVVQGLKALGVRTAPLCARFQLSRALLADPYSTIPLRHYVAFFEQAATLSGDPFFGLRLGEASPVESLGPVGFLLGNAPTLRLGLRRLLRFLAAWQGGTRMELLQNADAVMCTYQIEDAAIWPRRQDTEFSLALTCSLIRSLLGRQWRPMEVHFEHPAPAGRDLLDAVFRAPLRFAQPTNGLMINRADLDTPLARATDGVTPFIERQLQEMIDRNSITGTITQQTGLLVTRHLGSGRFAIEQIAGEMGLSPRSLQRRLSEEGTSFRAIVREQRQRAATMLVQSHDLPIGLIAQRLSYADATVLSRAFKTWTGKAPRAYLRQSSQLRR